MSDKPDTFGEWWLDLSRRPVVLFVVVLAVLIMLVVVLWADWRRRR